MAEEAEEEEEEEETQGTAAQGSANDQTCRWSDGWKIEDNKHKNGGKKNNFWIGITGGDPGRHSMRLRGPNFMQIG